MINTDHPIKYFSIVYIKELKRKNGLFIDNTN